MDILQALRTNHDELASMFHSHLEDVHIVQRTLLDRILPNILEDDTPYNEELISRDQDWIRDTASIFRMYKRHKFTASFTLEALRETLLWRLKHLPIAPPSDAQIQGFFSCLPPPACDALGRPIIIVRLSLIRDIALNIGQVQEYILYTLETLRHHLTRLNTDSKGYSNAILQYVLVLDLDGVSMRSVNVDLLAWYMQEAVSRFPGLLAAVLVLNSSWAQSGAWAILRHMLPDTALRRIFFPTQQELSTIIPSSALPKDYGGELPPLAELSDVLAIPTPVPPKEPIGHAAPSRVPRSPTRLSPHSIYNPYFGYSVYDGTSTYGRRRKRDLLFTLTLLFWERWHVRMTYTLAILFIMSILRFRGWTFVRLWKWLKLRARRTLSIS